MKRKARKATRPVSAEDESPDWLEAKPSVHYQRYTKASLDELVADLERGIKDLPVWKDYVRRFGLRKTRQLFGTAF